MFSVIKIGSVLLLFAGLTYVRSRLRPPNDVIGSHLEDSEHRTKQLIRAAKEQHYRETWYRGDIN